MAEIELPDAPTPVDLGAGIVLHPRGLRGTVRVGEAAAVRSLGSPGISASTGETGDLDLALHDAGLRRGRVVELPPAAAPAPGQARGLAAAAQDDAPTVGLDVRVDADESCVLLVEDQATGALEWVIPDDAEERGRAAREAAGDGTRGFAGDAQGSPLRFSVRLATVPASAAGAPAAAADGARAFSLGGLGKLVTTLVYKVTDPLLGPIIHGYARKWEAKNYPCFSRRFGAADYRVDDPAFARLTADDWRELSSGPALLFVHGTFSTSATFRALEPATVEALERRYEGRVFAFNHPTLSADPRENAVAFLGSVPAGTALEIDIVCHSRGGLVARQIAALGRLDGGRVDVRRIVFVAATNAGTALADDDHVVDLVGRYTTLAAFLPRGPAGIAVRALMPVVKVLGHGLLADLEGLRAMNPRGAFMKALNVAGDSSAEHYAIASDFEPRPGTPLSNWRRAGDEVVDLVFGDAANDLVVPRDGVYARNGAGGFPIDEARCLRFGPADGIVHTEFFGEPRTQAKLLEWLAPESAAAVERAMGPTPDDVARIIDAVRDRVLAELMPAGDAGPRGIGGALGGLGRSRVAARGGAFAPAELERLRPHVVNLSEGVFKESGLYSTRPADVDAIVHEHIPEWAARLPAGEPLRVVIWLHGGLVGERAGLAIAQKQVDWWKRNGVYPIYIAWEAGLFDALRSVLESVQGRLRGLGARDSFDDSTDLLIERGARTLGGVAIWGAMKRNAQLASAPGGGALYLAGRLRELGADAGLRAGRELQLHAVGHSAGAVFHSWFLPAAREAGAPAFKTLQLLAPAITVADFGERLAPVIGGAGGVEKALLYTMKKHFEEDDDCIGIYHKSLLYLVHHALEREPRTPILGLDISLRADAPTARLFGLNGAPNAPGRVVWSQTDTASGRYASRATSHSGFDDEPATMNSVAANVLDAAAARVPYGPSGARAAGGWPVADEWLDGVDLTGFRSAGGPAGGFMHEAAKPGHGGTGHHGHAGPAAGGNGGGGPAGAGGSDPAGGSAGGQSGNGSASPSATPPRSGGAKRALCIGIDDYPAPNTLAGCVNDMQRWKGVLEGLGFDVAALSNERATRAAILRELTSLVTSAKSGDVLVFQYAGHGTLVADADRDEYDQPDQALVPIDFQSGALLVDDDVRNLLVQLPAGVNLTCFFDCCHSATNTRLLGQTTDADQHAGLRSRFMRLTPEWERAHQRFRERELSLGRGKPGFPADRMGWVSFAACQDSESAYEVNGNGDFTRVATGLLDAAALGRSNREFHESVLKQFGDARRQTPYLDCAVSARERTLLRPLA